MKKPVIGITVNNFPAGDCMVSAGYAAPGQDFQCYATDYINFIIKAGGVPVVLPVIDDIDVAKSLWETLDGFIVTGGNDVDPDLYGERIIKEVGLLDLQRDRYEIELVKYAVGKDIPILGICRGCQVFNVAFDGSLHQDLPKDGFEHHCILVKPRNIASHSINVEKGTLLFDIIGKEKVGTNSFHHQAVKEPGKGLTVQAKSDDGVIESIWYSKNKFAMATQWHPEMMYDNSDMQKIANRLVKEASK